MTKALVGELSPNKIRVNCIVPGPFHTAATDYKVSTPELRENLEASIPLGFFADPSDLDGLILYLASSNASHGMSLAASSLLMAEFLGVVNRDKHQNYTAQDT